MKLDLKEKIRRDFPQTSRLIRGRPLVYLDSAATSLKPVVVAERLKLFYEQESANVNRGAHFLGDALSGAYEDARKAVAKFIGAKSSKQISFNSGTTLAINVLARSFAKKYLQAGDVVLTTQMEHHANIVPWQMVCEEKKATLKVVPITPKGELQLEELEKLLAQGNVKILAVTYVSNVLGTINPIKKICELAHRHNVAVLVDAAQAMLHLRVDVQDLDCDFLVFSGHKMLAPTGAGVLYMQEKYLQELPPVIGGGNMIRSVSFEKTTYADAPEKFEAGTPPISSVLGLKTAIAYMETTGFSEIQAREKQIANLFYEKLSQEKDLTLYGNSSQRAGIFSFTYADIHPHDISTILDSEGITIRAGHHCCQPLMQFYGIPATVRASVAFYNQEEDVDALIKGLHKARETFQ